MPRSIPQWIALLAAVAAVVALWEPPPSGAITREATSTVVNTTSTNTVTVPRPTGTAAGDVLVACLATNGGNVSGAGVPAGWTPIAAVTAINNPHVFGYYRIASALEPPSYSWSLTGSVTNGAGIARYSGVDDIAPLAASATTATGASSTSGSLPGVTTATPDAMLVGCMGINSSPTTITIASPAGMAQAWDIGGKRHELADGIQAAAGASGTKTWTFSASREWGGWLTALRAGAGAVPPAVDTTIDSGPSGTVGSASATFAFSATAPGSSFECALDGAAFAACSSPKTYTGLGEGTHDFQVRATDPSNNTDPPARPAEAGPSTPPPPSD